MMTRCGIVDGILEQEKDIGGKYGLEIMVPQVWKMLTAQETRCGVLCMGTLYDICNFSAKPKLF